MYQLINTNNSLFLTLALLAMPVLLISTAMLVDFLPNNLTKHKELLCLK